MKAFTEAAGIGNATAYSKLLEDSSASLALVEASNSFTDSIKSRIAPTLPAIATLPSSQLLGERFSQSLAPLVESQIRMSEMFAKSLELPALGIVMSQNNAMIAVAIKDLQAIYSAPNIRIQDIEKVIYPGVVGDIRGINASYRSLLTETAETAAARDNMMDLQQTWSRMLPPTSAVSSYTHSLRSEVAIDQDTEMKSCRQCHSKRTLRDRSICSL